MSDTPTHTPTGQAPQFELTNNLPVQYANLVRISHSISDIILDFAQFLPGNQAANIQARIVMSPLGAKLFLRALGDNLARYEAAFGEIPIPRNDSLAEHLFKPPTPPES